MSREEACALALENLAAGGAAAVRRAVPLDDAEVLPPTIAPVFTLYEHVRLPNGAVLCLSKARGPFFNVGYLANGDDLLVRSSDQALFTGRIEEPPGDTAEPLSPTLLHWLAALPRYRPIE